MPVTANTLPLLLKWRFAVIIGRDMLECDAELLAEAAPGSPGYSGRGSASTNDNPFRGNDNDGPTAVLNMGPVRTHRNP